MTHLKSGYAMAYGFLTEGAAQQFCAEILGLRAWNRVKARTQDSKRKSHVRDAVKAAAERHGGYR